MKSTGITQAPPGDGIRPGRELFAARRTTSDVIAAGVFGLVGIAIFTLTSMAGFESGRAGWMWGLGLPALLLLGGTAFLLLRRYYDDRPILKLSNGGMKARGLRSPLRWEQIEDVEYDERRMRLLVHVPVATGRRKPQVIPLSRLPRPEREAAFESVLARLSAKRLGLGLEEPRTARDLRDVAEFDLKMRELTPSLWAANGLVALNVLVWLLQVLGGMHPFAPSSESLYHGGGNSAWAVALDGQVWRMLTATFVHAGLMHLALNMVGLWAPSRQFARQNGNRQLVLVYLASGLCGSAASLHFSAQQAVSVGASGAVFGVLGALLASCWKYRRQLPRLNNKRLWSGPGLFTVYALVQGLGSARVDNGAHLGGLVCGGLLGFLLVAKFDAAQARRRLPLAALGAMLAATAVVVGVLTTPPPRTWHGPLFEGAAILRKAGPELQQLGRDGDRFKGRDAADPEARAFLEREVLPRCAAIRTEVRQVQLPDGDPVGRAAAMIGRRCALMEEAARLALAARTPEDRALAAVRMQAIQAEMQALGRETVKLNGPAVRTDPR
jgi:rhomboid protease GluP